MKLLHQYPIDEKIYIDLKEIKALFPHWCRGARFVTNLAERKGLNDVINGRVENGVLIETASFSKKSGSMFVNKEEVLELFDPANAIPDAPPLLVDDDLIFFKDDEGTMYNVPMRGERTQEGIFFQVKAVMKVFQMENLLNNIGKEHTTYEEGEHFVSFQVDSDEPNDHLPDLITSISYNVPNRRYKNKEVYLTYSGLRKVIETSRCGVGYKFKKWIDEVVFVAAFGTKRQKVDIASKILDIESDHLRALMSKCPTAITCLYLVNLDTTEDGKRIFKYGFTKDIRRRFGEHVNTYGKKAALDTFILIPELGLSKAEAEFKKCVSSYQFKRGKESELMALCELAYKDVKHILASISRQYCGNMQTQIAIYKDEIKDLKHAHEIEIKNLKHEHEIKDLKHAHEIKDLKLEMQLALAMKDNEILKGKSGANAA